jgi:hypothetical protein
MRLDSGLNFCWPDQLVKYKLSWFLELPLPGPPGSTHSKQDTLHKTVSGKTAVAGTHNSGRQADNAQYNLKPDIRSTGYFGSIQSQVFGTSYALVLQNKIYKNGN